MCVCVCVLVLVCLFYDKPLTPLTPDYLQYSLLSRLIMSDNEANKPRDSLVQSGCPTLGMAGRRGGTSDAGARQTGVYGGQNHVHAVPVPLHHE